MNELFQSWQDPATTTTTTIPPRWQDPTPTTSTAQPQLLLPCNGLISNCDLRINEALFPMVHNAMSSKEDNFLAYNNIYSLEDALQFGYRGLSLDSCDCSSSNNGSVNLGLQLCHGYCYYQDSSPLFPIGWRDPIEVFTNILTFLNDNPREIVLIDLQADDNTLHELYTSVLSKIGGFTDMMYAHTTTNTSQENQSQWPTMSELIERNERIILFAVCIQNSDSMIAEEANSGGGGVLCPSSKVHSTRRFVFDTSYDFTLNEILGGSSSANPQQTGGGLNDSTISSNNNNYVSSCVKDRGQSGLQTFYMSNHYANNEFTKLPSEGNANILNTYDVLQARHEVCKTAFGGKTVNILMVDFWSIHGNDVINYVDNENLQRYNEKFGIPLDRGGGDGSDWTNTNDNDNSGEMDPFFGDGIGGSDTTVTTSEATESLAATTNGAAVPSPSPAPLGNSTLSPTSITNATSSPTILTGGGGDNSWIDSTTEAINGLQLNDGGGRSKNSSAYTMIVAGCIAIGGILLIVLYACCKQRQQRRYKQEQQQGRRQQCRPMPSAASSSARPPSSSRRDASQSGGTTTPTAKKCPSSLSTAHSLSFGGED